MSGLHRHWYKIGDCICVVPLFCSWDQLFAGASEGSPLWPRTCGAKMWSSTQHHRKVATAGTSAEPFVLSHLRNFGCTDIFLQNKHRNMLFCLLGWWWLVVISTERTLQNINIFLFTIITEEKREMIIVTDFLKLWGVNIKADSKHLKILEHN